jgi:hypothetical protein
MEPEGSLPCSQQPAKALCDMLKQTGFFHSDN